MVNTAVSGLVKLSTLRKLAADTETPWDSLRLTTKFLSLVHSATTIQLIRKKKELLEDSTSSTAMTNLIR